MAGKALITVSHDHRLSFEPVIFVAFFYRKEGKQAEIFVQH